MARIITPDFTKSQGSFLDEPGAHNLVRGLRVTYTDRLRSYLAARPGNDILIAAYRPHGHMAVHEEDIRLISEDFADELIAKGIPFVIGSECRVLISNTWIPEGRNATIELDVASWLGIKNISAKGLKRQDILRPFAPLMQKID